MKNIITGFVAPKIWPISGNAFPNKHFEAASVTDRTLPLHKRETLLQKEIGTLAKKQTTINNQYQIKLGICK